MRAPRVFPTPAERVTDVAARFDPLLRQPMVRGLIDALAAEQMRVLRDWVERHRALLAESGLSELPEHDLIAALTGWVLGYSAVALPPEGRFRELTAQLQIAAFVAPWSAECIAQALARRVQ